MIETFYILGLLIYFEYLLTCNSDELGMLEDATEVLDALENVKVRFALATSSNDLLQPEIFGTRFYFIIVIPLPANIFARLPQILKDGTMIGIVPILFNIGIDHHASISRLLKLNLFSAVDVESALNYKNLNKLKAYISQSIENMPDGALDLIKLLSQVVNSNKPKNVDIFPIAEKICRLVHGIRVTGCKSAKDRTSMGFTLEQGHLLVNNHNVAKQDLQEIINQLRRNGTSIENALINTGSRAYAFGYVQLLTFPEYYRAQAGTYGDVQT